MENHGVGSPILPRGTILRQCYGWQATIITMEFIKNITNRDFLINQTPASDLSSLLPWIVVFGGLIILSIALMILFRRINPVVGKFKGMINTWMISLGLTGLLIVFFRSQQLSIFSKNLFLGIILIAWFIWLIFIIFWVIFRYPEQIYQFREKERIKKYIPRSKKHKK